jgi:hypothetical protein
MLHKPLGVVRAVTHPIERQAGGFTLGPVCRSRPHGQRARRKPGLHRVFTARTDSSPWPDMSGLVMSGGDCLVPPVG